MKVHVNVVKSLSITYNPFIHMTVSSSLCTGCKILSVSASEEFHSKLLFYHVFLVGEVAEALWECAVALWEVAWALWEVVHALWEVVEIFQESPCSVWDLSW